MIGITTPFEVGSGSRLELLRRKFASEHVMEKSSHIQVLHAEFNEASARVKTLKRLIEIRESGSERRAHLTDMLQAAEVDKKRAHAALAEVELEKIVPRAGRE